MIEYFTDPKSGQAMYRIDDGPVRELTEKDYDIIESIIERSKNFYPEQYDELCNEYAKSAANKSYYDFLLARRIINCCFGEHDSQPDIDSFGNYHFERVKCPRIAECKNHKIICQPVFNSKLTGCELKVMELLFRHIPVEQIAEKLFLSIHTVKNHRRNALQRLSLHSTEEFIGYAHKNRLFEKE
jgi:DNA-binding CsgD family transcriptional regulator